MIEMIVFYRCVQCGSTWNAPSGPTRCIVCGSLYVERPNYGQGRGDVPPSESGGPADGVQRAANGLARNVPTVRNGSDGDTEIPARAVRGVRSWR